MDALVNSVTFIYPALLSFFVYTIATLFQNRKGMKMVRIVSLTVAIIYFLAALYCAMFMFEIRL